MDPDTREMLKELEMDRLPNISTSNTTLTGMTMGSKLRATWEPERERERSIHIYIYIIHIHICVCIHKLFTYICIYIYMCTYLYIYIYVYGELWACKARVSRWVAAPRVLLESVQLLQ